MNDDGNARDNYRHKKEQSVPTKRMTVMVVEDESLLLEAITKKLKLSGLDVLSCASGQQAIDYLGSIDHMPDIVWLDYYLKDMDGLAFMETLKSDPSWQKIPVMVVSNSASPEKVHHMLTLGAKKYILKAEYRLDEIINMLQSLVTETTAETATENTTATGQPAGSEVHRVKD